MLLLLAYALGAATSLGLALLVGGRVFAAMKKSLGAGQWVRRVLGVLVLAAVTAVAMARRSFAFEAEVHEREHFSQPRARL